MKLWVPNQIVEITRLTDCSAWRYARSENMITDLGTRKGAKITYVDPDSCWINGLPWMHGEEANFPLKTDDDIIMSCKENSKANKENSKANKEKILAESNEKNLIV